MFRSLVLKALDFADSLDSREAGIKDDSECNVFVVTKVVKWYNNSFFAKAERARKAYDREYRAEVRKLLGG